MAAALPTGALGAHDGMRGTRCFHRRRQPPQRVGGNRMGLVALGSDVETCVGEQCWADGGRSRWYRGAVHGGLLGAVSAPER